MSSRLFRRLLSNYSSGRGAPLYELPPKVLYPGLWYLVFAGRRRWTCCASTESDLEVRGGIGYGD